MYMHMYSFCTCTFYVYMMNSLLLFLQRLQDQDGQLAALEKELSEATHTITILTDRLEGEGKVGVVNELEVKVQSRERELAMEAERRRTVSV